MSLETDIARLADVLEKGFANLTAAIARQSEIAASPTPPTLPAATPEPPAKRGRPAAAAPVEADASVCEQALVSAKDNRSVKIDSFDRVRIA